MKFRMISRITLGDWWVWLLDMYERHFNHNHIIDQQSQTIIGLMQENSALSRQVERTQNELTKAQESYQFYFDAYIREMQQRDQNTKRH